MVDSVLEVQNIKTTGISPQKDIVTTDSGTGDVTVKGNVVVPDSGTIGSTSATGAVTIDSSGNVTFANEIQSGVSSSFSTTSGGSTTVNFTVSDNSVYEFKINFYNNDGNYMAAGNVHIVNGLMGYHTDYYKKRSGASASGSISFSISGSTLTFSYTAPANVNTTSTYTRINLSRKFKL